MTSIRIFDDNQRKDAKEQAKAMRGSDQPFRECIEFGHDWAKIGLSFAHRDYEAVKALRKEYAEFEEIDEESA